MSLSHALGCVMGQLVGDASGAVLEFHFSTITSAVVKHAMQMPGGGALRVSSGQITDDGELAMSLMRGLLKMKEPTDDELDEVATMFHKWYQSGPFDMGATTSCALSSYTRESPHNSLIQGAIKRNMGSLSNGGLMRCTPLAVYLHRTDQQTAVKLIQTEAALTHSNPICHEMNTAYLLCCITLIQTGGDRKQAIAVTKKWVDENARTEAKQWLEEALSNQIEPFGPRIGFAKIGFTHAFRHLQLGSSYEEAIAETLLGGGDTDTNAAIVGGMIGAAVGIDGIPDYMKKPVESCQPNHARPDWLHSKQAPELIEQLFNHAPGPATQQQQQEQTSTSSV